MHMIKPNKNTSLKQSQGKLYIKTTIKTWCRMEGSLRECQPKQKTKKCQTKQKKSTPTGRKWLQKGTGKSLWRDCSRVLVPQQRRPLPSWPSAQSLKVAAPKSGPWNIIVLVGRLQNAGMPYVVSYPNICTEWKRKRVFPYTWDVPEDIQNTLHITASFCCTELNAMIFWVWITFSISEKWVMNTCMK